MIHATLLLVALGLAATPQAPSSDTTSQPSPCVAGLSQMSDVATGQLCAAEQALRRGESAAKGSRERTQAFDAAATGLRRAVNLSTRSETTVRALNLLATVDRGRPPEQQRGPGRGAPRVDCRDANNHLTPMYRLATVLEDRQLIEAAEATLLDARHREPDAEEPNRMLAQFSMRGG